MGHPDLEAIVRVYRGNNPLFIGVIFGTSKSDAAEDAPKG